MTSRIYSDLRVSSSSGKFRLEALSKDNRAGFHYRLSDTSSQQVVWVRRQERGEGSPVSGLVSDDGVVVIRASLDWASEQLLFIDVTGKTRLAIIVSAGDRAEAQAGKGGKAKAARPAQPTVVWKDDHVEASSAGPLWSAGAVETFPASPEIEASYFCLRTAWGRRLIVDLASMKLVEESFLTEELQALVEGEERTRALDALAALAASVQSGVADGFQQSRVEGAVVVAMTQKIAEAGPFLHQLERAQSGGSRTACAVIGERWYSDHNAVRALARLALRFLGEEPAPGGNYAFTSALPGAPRDDANSFPAASIAAPAKAWELAKAAPPGVAAEWVLANLGAPDFIRREKRKVDKYFVWSEVWDYDGPTTTTRLMWSFPEASRRGVADVARTVAEVEVVEAWQDPARLMAVLGFTVR